MRVAKLILVVEPGTGRTSKLVPIQHNGVRAVVRRLCMWRVFQPDAVDSAED
jgi:hypothetical protein